MLIAIDGACKRNGQPDCLAVGVAFIKEDNGNILFQSRAETCSTNQRGELYGLVEALKYFIAHNEPDEDCIIVTDSEYLFNTIEKRWFLRWEKENWVGSSGDVVKNVDIWTVISKFVDTIGIDRIFMQWTKGHLMSYANGPIKYAMAHDASGIELYSNITTIANRGSEKNAIYQRWLEQRVKHDYSVYEPAIALEHVIMNTTADCIASYVVNKLNDTGSM